MAAKSEKITVAREDVLTALGKHNVPDLNTLGDVARWVVTRVHGVENLYDSGSALYLVKQVDLKRLLADMVVDGALILRVGTEWFKHGAPTWLGRPNGHYYALPEKAREWEEEAARKRAKDRQERAEKLAKVRLTELHPQQYADLVNEYLAAYDRVSTDNPELFQ
jgi:hypothetical protein